MTNIDHMVNSAPEEQRQSRDKRELFRITVNLSGKDMHYEFKELAKNDQQPKRKKQDQ